MKFSNYMLPFFVLLLSACQTLTSNNGHFESRADRLSRYGDYSGAAFLYEYRAKKHKGEKRRDLLLKAAENHLLAKDQGAAHQIFIALNITSAEKVQIQATIKTRRLQALELSKTVPGDEHYRPEREDDYYLGDNHADEIAILLPASGPYLRAAKAIRAGIEAAHNSIGAQHKLRFIDSRNLRAAQGKIGNASIVIGPLSKSNVSKILKTRQTNKLWITLNKISNKSPKGFYQLGFSPADEGTAIAKRMAANGHQSALVIYPKTTWGQGYYRGFRERFLELGGSIIKSVQYSRHAKELSPVVKKLSGFKADAVFIIAKAPQAQQLIAFSHYYGHANTSIFTTSSAYDRRLYKKGDRELKHLHLPVLRWSYPGATPNNLPQWADVQQMASFNPALARFYALGIDAMLLASQVDALVYGSILRGATGDLQATGSGIIKRDMLWVSQVNNNLISE